MPATRRASRRASLRRGSISILPQKSAEIPWDILERLFMPFLFCHAAAIIISTLLHAFNLSTISTFAVFVWFALSTVGAVLFYHFVKDLSNGLSSRANASFDSVRTNEQPKLYTYESCKLAEKY
ncbi:hypothetical protein GQX74_015617 [Glossina fuscipes]|nr:hypothetical protein GQX74_015617 [Glossina fuscipes]